MRKKIQTQLRRIEEEENIKILLAVESGSRAWGFASPDSDYDVRFIYIRRMEDYLKLEKVQDVIELPMDDVLDMNGWDLQKTLRLLYKSNPTLFEWFSSPIVYQETEFADKFRDLMIQYFSSKKTLYHYISMAEGNYREYLKGDFVRAKKYFYVLRPVLACQWILDQGTPPPMLFSELMEAELPAELTGAVKQLLEIKMNSPEVKLIPRIPEINEYLDKSILDSLDKRIKDIGDDKDREMKFMNYHRNTIVVRPLGYGKYAVVSGIVGYNALVMLGVESAYVRMANVKSRDQWVYEIIRDYTIQPVIDIDEIKLNIAKPDQDRIREKIAYLVKNKDFDEPVVIDKKTLDDEKVSIYSGEYNVLAAIALGIKSIRVMVRAD